MTTHAHLNWTASALGAGFGATWVQRQDPVTSGWWDIAKSVVEATHTFDDYECRRNVVENYRVLTETNLGVRSVALAATPVTVTGLGDCIFEMVSNADPTLNGVFPLGSGISVDLPEHMTVTDAVGRDGQMLSRSSEVMGEDWDQTLALTGAVGPDLWASLVDKLRRDVPYVCVLSPWGHRWFAGLAPSAVKGTLLGLVGSRPSALSMRARMVQVAYSPTVASF